MHAIRHTASPFVKPAPLATVEGDLAVLARQTGVAIETLRTFASIEAPKNKGVFSAEAAKNAFSSVKIRKVEF